MGSFGAGYIDVKKSPSLKETTVWLSEPCRWMILILMMMTRSRYAATMGAGDSSRPCHA